MSSNAHNQRGERRVQPVQLSRLEPDEKSISVVDDVPAHLVAPRPTYIWERRSVVLLLLAFLGPVGLLPLWFSRRFGTRGKTLITLGYFAGTILFPIAMIWYFCDYALHPLADALKR